MSKKSGVNPLGEDGKRLTLQPTIEESLFFRFLLLSPSYELAHKIRTGQISIRKKILPADIHKVLDIYDLVGNIYAMRFDDWWHLKGKDIFASKKGIDKLLISLDLKRPKVELLDHVDGLIDSAIKIKNNESKNKKIILLTNKVHITSLFAKYLALRNKVWSIKDGKPLENWKNAIRSRMVTKWLWDLNVNEKKTVKNLKARQYLSMLVSKGLKEVLYFSENAARGEFPNPNKPEYFKPFDYENLVEILSNNGELECNREKWLTDKEYLPEWRKMHDKISRDWAKEREILRKSRIIEANYKSTKMLD